MHNDLLGPKIKTLNTLFEKQLTKQMEKFDQTDRLTSGQMSLVVYLYDHQDDVIYQRDMETIFDLSRPTINGIVKRLKENGAIDVLPDEKDKRYKRIVLTESFLKQMNDFRPIFEHEVATAEEKMTAGLNAEEIAQLGHLLDVCRENLK